MRRHVCRNDQERQQETSFTKVGKDERMKKGYSCRQPIDYVKSMVRSLVKALLVARMWNAAAICLSLGLQ